METKMQEEKVWKVLIADDEKKVCQLIRYLVPWEELHLSVAAVVYNGLEAIEVLKEYDQAHRTEYLDTLRIYLAQNRNAVKSAAQLHIHKSTFFYRLGKITEILGMEWETAGKLFSYELSFRLGREELSVGN